MKGFYYAIITVVIICAVVFSVSPLTSIAIGRMEERLDSVGTQDGEAATKILEYYSKMKFFFSITLKDSELIKIENEIYDVIYSEGDEQELLKAKSRLRTTLDHLRQQFAVNIRTLLYLNSVISSL